MSAREISSTSFEQTWASLPGLAGWLCEVNNRPLGIRFMVTGFAFFLAGGVLALLMRLQLAVADATFLGPQRFNEFFSMHGSTMMFLFAVPFLEGLAIYLLPGMIGSRDVAFPRLTAFGYWTYLFGGLMFYASFLWGTVPDAGWFSYVPLSGPRFAHGGMDFWALGLSLVEISGITAGAEIVVTILKLRAPGMTINRMPLFVWAVLVSAGMMLFAFTTLLVATLLLEMDRANLTRFFEPAAGGNVLLWQHLFWFFGHPEVYIIFLPATGIVSMVVGAFARRIAGYTLIAVAIVITGFMSFGLWVHHMYTTGLPPLSMAFFAAASLMIAIASGIQVFAWIASLWGRRPALKTPLWFVLGFIFNFVLGGMTGVMVAIVPFDWQVHDTYFIVAHFHYVLIGGAVFPIFAGLHYWVPKMSGRMMGEKLGQTSFWLIFVGFNTTFFPMHIMGFLGLPRRVYTYMPELQLDGYNLVATVGAFVMGLGVLVFLINLFYSLGAGQHATANPWGGDSLEWSTDSPPPAYGFYQLPVVRSRHPLWQPAANYEEVPGERAAQALAGKPERWRGTLSSDALEAAPQAIHYLAGPSPWPIIASLWLLIGFVGVLLQLYLLSAFGVICTAVAVMYWLRPRPQLLAMLEGEQSEGQYPLTIFPEGSSSPNWWGAVSLVVVLGTALGALLYCYFYLRLYSEVWPQGDLPMPERWRPLIWYGALILSAPLQFGAAWGWRRGRLWLPRIALAAGFILAAAFVGLFTVYLAQLPFRSIDNAYASVFYVLCWYLWSLVVVSLLVSMAFQVRLWTEESPVGSDLQLQIVNMLWYFSVVAGVIIYGTLHLAPHIL